GDAAKGPWRSPPWSVSRGRSVAAPGHRSARKRRSRKPPEASASSPSHSSTVNGAPVCARACLPPLTLSYPVPSNPLPPPGGGPTDTGGAVIRSWPPPPSPSPAPPPSPFPAPPSPSSQTTVNDSSVGSETLPAASVCVADSVCWPHPSSGASIAHVPSAPTCTVPRDSPSPTTSTVAPGSPVPSTVGLRSATCPSSCGFVTTGASGGVVSSSPTMITGSDSADVTPSSVWVAVIVWFPGASGSVSSNRQLP